MRGSITLAPTSAWGNGGEDNPAEPPVLLRGQGEISLTRFFLPQPILGDFPLYLLLLRRTVAASCARQAW